VDQQGAECNLLQFPSAFFDFLPYRWTPARISGAAFSALRHCLLNVGSSVSFSTSAVSRRSRVRIKIKQDRNRSVGARFRD